MSTVRALRPEDPEWIAEYRLKGRLSRSVNASQGTVYLATGTYGEMVAVRRIPVPPGNDRFRRELAQKVVAADLVAPLGTAQILDVHLEGYACVVSEYIEGATLRERIDRDGPMAGGELRLLAIGTAVALAAIHRAGIAHSNLGPGNVIMAEDGPTLVDFGLPADAPVPLQSADGADQAPTACLDGCRPARLEEPAEDMLAWGSVIRFAATGNLNTASTSELSHVPKILADLLSLAFSDDPRRRPSAQQALARLLGRPALGSELSDPVPVLAEAAWLVRAIQVAPRSVPVLSEDRPQDGAGTSEADTARDIILPE